ncbi:MAG TPA: indolepyruvate oxidoreductase subunit beta, partial [Bacillota bacterium]|nr:indolepyruvate oxidoreductase subunit beta [Bacillota bacterium]
GILRASDILCEVMIRTGLDVKKSEVHGMAQRGGCVTSHVRYGTCVHSPIAKKGDVGILIAFEKMEAVRYANFLKPGGIAVINDYEIVPMSVATGLAEYPEGTIEAMENNFKIIRIKAADIAMELGNPKCMNVVLFGAMVRALGMDKVDWEEILREQLSPSILDINLKAFNATR